MATKLISKKFVLQKKDVQADGTFKCVFATMGVVDKDGDVTKPGFFGEQAFVVVPVHDWNHVPIGKAVCYEDGDKAIAEGKFNLDIESAADWFKAMQFDLDEDNGAPLMEWSYGFKTLDGGSSMGKLGDQQVRYLQPLPDGSAGCKIYEVSPVLVGAGEKTRTLAAKDGQPVGEDDEDCPDCKTGTCCEGCADCDPSVLPPTGQQPKRFIDQSQAVLDAAELLAKRGASLAGLRAKDGRELSAESKERLSLIASSFMETAKGILQLIAPKAARKEEAAAPAPSPELVKEMARALKIIAGTKA